MKKSLLLLCFAVFSLSLVQAQCVFTCANYNVSQITFTNFPTAGTNAIPLFSPNTDDGYTPPVPLGFNFNFYCTSYNSVLVYSNGLLQFNIGAPSTFPFGYDAAQSLPDPWLPTVLNGIIAFKMDDLDPGVGGSVTYTTVGVTPNQMFVLTYSDVPIYGNPGLLNSGQIVLFETTNIIEIHTISAPLSPNLATQGIEDATGTQGKAPTGRNQAFWSATNSAYRFAPYTPAPPTSISGPTNICQGTQNAYNTVPMVGATSYTWDYPSGWSGPFNTTAVTTTAGAAGGVSVTATYTCGTSAPTVLNVSVTPAPVVSIASANPMILCSGQTLTITPSGASTYTLYPGPITGNPPFVITADASTTYSLVGADAASGCLSYNLPSTSILVNPSPTVTVSSGSICLGQTFSMSPSGAVSYAVTGGFPVVTPLAAGIHTYAVSGTAQNNCVSPAPVISTVVVSPNPTVNVTANRYNLCLGETSVLTASVADTYSWNTGSVAQSISVSPTLTGSYNYTVTGSTAAGCSRAKSISIVVFACTGIDEASAGSTGVSVYPNPSDGLLNLKFESLQNNTAIDLYDATGRLVLSHKATGQELQLDLSDYASGLYYIKVKSGQAVETLKVVKE